MVLVELTVAVADAAEGIDVLAGQKWASESKFDRQVVGAALTGSAAVDDTRLAIYYGSVKVGQIYNNKTGLVVDIAADMKPHHSMLRCQAGETLGVVVEDPPATNPIKLILDVAEVQ